MMYVYKYIFTLGKMRMTDNWLILFNYFMLNNN